MTQTFKKSIDIYKQLYSWAKNMHLCSIEKGGPEEIKNLPSNVPNGPSKSRTLDE